MSDVLHGSAPAALHFWCEPRAITYKGHRWQVLVYATPTRSHMLRSIVHPCLLLFYVISFVLFTIQSCSNSFIHSNLFFVCNLTTRVLHCLFYWFITVKLEWLIRNCQTWLIETMVWIWDEFCLQKFAFFIVFVVLYFVLTRTGIGCTNREIRHVKNVIIGDEIMTLLNVFIINVAFSTFVLAVVEIHTNECCSMEYGTWKFLLCRWQFSMVQRCKFD